MAIMYKLVVSADAEGRRTDCVGYFTSRALAQDIRRTAYKNRGWNSNEFSIDEVPIYSSIEEFVTENDIGESALAEILKPEELTRVLRRRALAKLTEAERAAMKDMFSQLLEAEQRQRAEQEGRADSAEFRGIYSPGTK